MLFVYGSIACSLAAARGEDMSSVLLGVFEDYDVAERLLVGLVRDGFPTDRVELTCRHSLGRAGLHPTASLHDKLAQYFCSLFSSEGERPFGQQLAERVENGAVTVTVHPRGLIEAQRAAQLLYESDPVEVAEHDMANQGMEHAAASSDGAWIRHFWIPSSKEYHCIYCRMFGDGARH
jgi:hypothetical protein